MPEDGVVIWGKGFEVDRVGRLPWLADVEVVYWGDIDTHGFAILDRLRAWLPQTRSVLMDRETLLAHRDRWGTEDRPATSALSTPDYRPNSISTPTLSATPSDARSDSSRSGSTGAGSMTG